MGPGPSPISQSQTRFSHHTLLLFPAPAPLPSIAHLHCNLYHTARLPVCSVYWAFLDRVKSGLLCVRWIHLNHPSSKKQAPEDINTALQLQLATTVAVTSSNIQRPNVSVHSATSLTPTAHSTIILVLDLPSRAGHYPSPFQFPLPFTAPAPKKNTRPTSSSSSSSSTNPSVQSSTRQRFSSGCSSERPRTRYRVPNLHLRFRTVSRRGIQLFVYAFEKIYSTSLQFCCQVFKM